MGRYRDDFIEEVRSRNDIVEVISQYVTLKKAGKNYLGLCPFHSERTPSFTVSPEKQMFYCFGCQAGGNVITFLMKRDNLTFTEALKFLADRAGLRLPGAAISPEEARRLREREGLYAALESAATYFEQQLSGSRAGNEALEYLRGRGLSRDIIARFRIGYAPPDGEALISHLLHKGFSVAVLEKAGLAVGMRGAPVARFRHRVMFPISDRQGRIIAFGGRVLDGSQPKYLNSPETGLFNKRETWYGLHLAREAIRYQGRAIIVEGYMDLVTAYGQGIENVVASLGTSLSREQVKAILQYTGEVIIAYDADTAGQQATMRGLELVKEMGGEVRVAMMPAGADPDAFLRREGRQAFLRLVEEALPLVEYRLELARRRYDSSTLAGRVRIVRELVPVLAAMDNAVEQAAYLKQVAQDMGVPEEALRLEIKKTMERKGTGRENRNIKGEIRNTKDSIAVANSGGEAPWLTPARLAAEKSLLRLMLEDNQSAFSVRTEVGPEDFGHPVHREIAATIYSLAEKGQPWTPSALADRLPGEALRLISRWSLEETEPPAAAGKVVRDCIKTLREHKMKRRLQEIQEQIRCLERRGERASRELLREYQELVRDYKGKAGP